MYTQIVHKRLPVMVSLHVIHVHVHVCTSSAIHVHVHNMHYHRRLVLKYFVLLFCFGSISFSIFVAHPTCMLFSVHVRTIMMCYKLV